MGPDSGMPDAQWLTQRAADVTVAVKLKPRSGADRIAGVRENMLEVHVKAPPVDGKANEALVRVIARAVGRPRSEVELLRGKTGRRKVVLIRGIGSDQARRKLTEALRV